METHAHVHTIQEPEMRLWCLQGPEGSVAGAAAVTTTTRVYEMGTRLSVGAFLSRTVRAFHGACLCVSSCLYPARIAAWCLDAAATTTTVTACDVGRPAAT